MKRRNTSTILMLAQPLNWLVASGAFRFFGLSSCNSERSSLSTDIGSWDAQAAQVGRRRDVDE